MVMMQRVFSVAALAVASIFCGVIQHVEASMSNTMSVPVEQVVDGVGSAETVSKDKGFNFTKWAERRGPSREEREEERIARSKRIKERRERARKRFEGVRPDPSTLTRMTREELEKMRRDNGDDEQDEHQWLRRAGWSWNGGVSGDYEPYGNNNMMDPSQEYDKWAQAYRMLGGYIDCDQSKSDEGSHDSGDNNNGDGDGQSACSRWMIWSAYVNPNYQGNEYYEYFGDDPTGVLDCHSPDSEWEVLGIYRQEFYQFIEQISKHLWAIDEYEYVVALAGLAYMTDYDCFYVGADNSGNSIYAGVVPQEGGKFRMGLYTDGYCITEDTSTGMTFDDFGLTSDVALGSGDNGYYDNDVGEWWSDAQEYTLTLLNEVYDTFRYCTSCVDYPTYQDGYFIGDYGTDDDDLINQCWKFWSHDSFVCSGDCLAKAHAQGTILSVNYGGVMWGETPSSFYTTASGGSKKQVRESRWSRLASNIFLTVSFMVFVATFLAFAVARRSRHRERKSSKSRRLLEDDREHSSRRRRRRKDGDGVFRSSKTRRSSRTRREEEGDGVFRSSSKSRRPSEGKSRKSSSRRSKSASRRRDTEDSGDYQPPNPDGEEHKRSSSRSRRASTSARRDDEF